MVKHGFVEQSLANAEPEKGYQFEREGYFCADNKDSRPEHLVFNLTVSLKRRLLILNNKVRSKNHVNFDRTFFIGFTMQFESHFGKKNRSLK